MARKIRRIGLKLVVLALCVFARAAPAGWRRSTRRVTLRGT